ncbi:hypothetical protein CXB51_031952 [Gossypium anomalum]|uniref:Reverse transcriptase Ty1/copia-type domain-containing protein n=1 Tax=Gossypium anomalum TaxID=47600 RepID=A0A8J5XU47_9ROSI|nr:hypothetical protein CXB51_031952 [Gossypium anomalum]
MVMKIELNNLSLEEKEDSELQVPSELGVGVGVNYELCLVGKFLVEIPKLIEFRYADFWVVHDLPLNFALESLTGIMGNLMGKFLDYDTTSQCNYLNNYMSIRVHLNANDHLLRRKKLRKQEVILRKPHSIMNVCLLFAIYVGLLGIVKGTMSSWSSCRRPRFSKGDRRISVGGLALKLVNIGAMEEGGGALVDPNWKEVVLAEYDALLSNNTWTLVELPPDCKPIGCKWLLKVKKNPDGTVARFKPRLVGKCFSQVTGHDFRDTYNPFVKFSTVNVFLSLATYYGWNLRKIDINNVFLKGELSEDDLGSLEYFLGIEDKNLGQGLFLNQQKYAIDLLTNAAMINSQLVPTPMVVGRKLTKDDGALLHDSQHYRMLTLFLGDHKNNGLYPDQQMRPSIAASLTLLLKPFDFRFC